VAAGGGASVTVRPSYATTTNRVTTEITTGSWGFPCQTAELFSVAPDFTQGPTSTTPPRYEHRWHWTCGPNDPAGASGWNITGIEWDLTNRGRDYGYQPNIYRAAQPSVAFWVGPVSIVPAFASGGGTPINWNTVYTVFSGQSDGAVTGVYQAFSTQPNSLVGRKFDPVGGHGGVGVDLFGSFSTAPANNPFSVTSGSNIVTAQMWAGEMIGQANGDQVWIPNTYTVNGVTFGNATYTMSAVDTVNGRFSFPGTGNATANGSGGGLGVVVNFLDFAPYAPFQTWGLFQHGLITTPGTKFLSNAIIETQVGNAIQWSDGTGTGTITTNGGVGNFDITVTPPGVGRVMISGNNLIVWGISSTVGIYAGAGQARAVDFRTGNVPRWMLTVDSVAEGGANAGSNFNVGRYSDAGAFVANALAINRATGNVTIAQSFGVNGSAPPAKPTVTGSRAANAALASLLTALASYGLVTDSSTA
jgi:hypothetical protein